MAQLLQPKQKIQSIKEYSVFEVADIPESQETDEEIITRISKRFEILDTMTAAIKEGQFKSMIVSGAPGIGKTTGICKVLDRYDTIGMLRGKESDNLVLGGETSPLGLYMKLWEYRKPGQLLVLDDCDRALLDQSCLNLLKRSLDTGGKRLLSWNKDSRTLRENEIDNDFLFEGGVIFVTNINFDYVKSKTLRPHLDALMDRVHYLDLTIHTPREKMLRIRQCIRDGMLDDDGFTKQQIDELINFVEQYRDRARILSLRLVRKVADLMKSMPNWRDVAMETCMRGV